MALLCSGAPFLSSNWPKKKRCFASTFRFDGEATFAGMCPSASGVLASQGLLSTDCWMSSSRASHMRNWKNADLLVMPTQVDVGGREGRLGRLGTGKGEAAKEQVTRVQLQVAVWE